MSVSRARRRKASSVIPSGPPIAWCVARPVTASLDRLNARVALAFARSIETITATPRATPRTASPNCHGWRSRCRMLERRRGEIMRGSSGSEPLPDGPDESEEVVEMMTGDLLDLGRVHDLVTVHQDVPEPDHIVESRRKLVGKPAISYEQLEIVPILAGKTQSLIRDDMRRDVECRLNRHLKGVSLESLLAQIRADLLRASQRPQLIDASLDKGQLLINEIDVGQARPAPSGRAANTAPCPSTRCASVPRIGCAAKDPD